MLVLVCMETNTPAAPGNLTFTWLFDGDLEDDQVILHCNWMGGGDVSVMTMIGDTQCSAMSAFILNNVARVTGSMEGDGGM